MSDTYTTPILLRGDMIASLSGQPTNQGNPGDANFGIVLPDVTALGTANDLYRLVWTGNTSTSPTASAFANGQYWTLQVYDPTLDDDGSAATGDAGWSTVAGLTNLNPRNDLVGGLGDGDEYVVFNTGSGHLLYDINGGLPSTPTTLTYLAANENGAPTAGDNDGALDFYDSYNAVVCFAAGTLIDTPDGARPVEALEAGDRVTTRAGEARPIAWAAGRHISATEMAASPNLRPVRIQAGALGEGLPERDLVVSPQHRLLVRSAIAQRLTGAPEVLVAAIHLTHLPGITRISPVHGVTYHHIMFDAHEVVFANGAPAESFLPGPQAMRAITPAHRAEIVALFPELAITLPGMQLRSALPLVSGRQAREIVARHRHHHHALIAA